MGADTVEKLLAVSGAGLSSSDFRDAKTRTFDPSRNRS